MADISCEYTDDIGKTIHAYHNENGIWVSDDPESASDSHLRIRLNPSEAINLAHELLEAVEEYKAWVNSLIAGEGA